MYDAIAIGALNVDYIMTAQKTKAWGAQLPSDITGKFECGKEKPVSEDQIQYVLSRAGLSSFEVFLGGSAFNTIHAVAATTTGFRLGFVGVAGNTGVYGLDFCDTLEQLGVDSRYVLKASSSSSGVCVSFMREGQRALITNPGANSQVRDHLMNNYHELTDYLAQARVIHVTPFFDEKTPAILLSLLTEAKRQNPTIRLSIDPGHHWVTNQTDDVHEILKLADFLFLNEFEFVQLAERGIGLSDNELAERVLRLCNPGSPVVLLKTAAGIKCFDRKGERLRVAWYSNVNLHADSISDDTGAGDVFAGGFLTAVLSDGMKISDGVSLGLRLVNAKLLSAGSRAFISFPEIFNELIREIGHG
jgi:sugar/nucleoside kinase (ribokinase family)